MAKTIGCDTQQIRCNFVCSRCRNNGDATSRNFPGSSFWHREVCEFRTRNKRKSGHLERKVVQVSLKTVDGREQYENNRKITVYNSVCNVQRWFEKFTAFEYRRWRTRKRHIIACKRFCRRATVHQQPGERKVDYSEATFLVNLWIRVTRDCDFRAIIRNHFCTGRNESSKQSSTPFILMNRCRLDLPVTTSAPIRFFFKNLRPFL